jgi:hypothetical protein
MAGNDRHDSRGGALIRRVVLADDDDFRSVLDFRGVLDFCGLIHN